MSLAIFRARVLDDHPPAAPAAPQQSAQQRGPLTRRARAVVPGAVGLESLLIGLESGPGDVGRQPVADQDQALLRPADELAGGRPPRPLAARADRPVAEPV